MSVKRSSRFSRQVSMRTPALKALMAEKVAIWYPDLLRRRTKDFGIYPEVGRYVSIQENCCTTVLSSTFMFAVVVSRLRVTLVDIPAKTRKNIHLVRIVAAFVAKQHMAGRPLTNSFRAAVCSFASDTCFGGEMGDRSGRRKQWRAQPSCDDAVVAGFDDATD